MTVLGKTSVAGWAVRTSALLSLLAGVPLAATVLRADDVELRGYLLAPKAFRAAVDRVTDSMVTIETYGGIDPATGTVRAPGGISRPGDGPTTGLIISPDGYILTSTFNFLRKPPIITVVLPDGSRKVAQLLGRDDSRRICVLKVDGVDNLPVPQLATPNELRVGQWAISVGLGFGDDPVMAAGIISATRRIGGRAVQTDANISPVNYGGPLVDIDGRVIGICVPLSPQASSPAAGVEWYDSGIGFAIPLAGAESLIERMKAGEEIRQGRLGVQVRAADDEGRGVMVERVVDSSPAAEAGIRAGDRIVSVAGQAVEDVPALMNLVGRHAAGDTVAVVVRRGEEELTFDVTLADAAQFEPQPEPKQPEPKQPEPKQPEPKQPEPKQPEPKPGDDAPPEAPN